jgi:hypothetical protein
MVIANWTRQDKRDAGYSLAATDEIFFLLNDVPRSQAGAISHRTEGPELWSIHFIQFKQR